MKEKIIEVISRIIVIWIFGLVWWLIMASNETSAQTKQTNTCKMIETAWWKVYIKDNKDVYCVVPFNS